MKRSAKSYEEKRHADTSLSLAANIRGSTRWQHFREVFRAKHPLCFNPFRIDGHLKAGDEIHHIIELRKRPDLAFEESNCANLCRACHHRVSEMERTGKDAERLFVMGKVTIVAGPPGAGKTHYVNEHKQDGDVVVDLDALMSSLSGTTKRVDYQTVLPFALAARNAVIASIENQGMTGGNAWIVGLLPSRAERDELAKRTKAEVIVLEVNAQECMWRIERDYSRQNKNWRAIVDEWWSKYEK